MIGPTGPAGPATSQTALEQEAGRAAAARWAQPIAPEINITATPRRRIDEPVETLDDLPPASPDQKAAADAVPDCQESKSRSSRARARGCVIWTAPTELPDLRHADNNLVALDTEENEQGLRADRGSSWPWHGGWVCSLSVAWREGGEIRAVYLPIRHPDSISFDPATVARWLKDHIVAGVRFATLNAPFDWGWLGTDFGVTMPPSSQLEEVGVLAALVDENQLKYSLDELCQRYNLPGKDTALLEEACKAAGFKITKKNPAQSYIWQLPARVCGPYGEGDAINTLLLHETLIPIIEREGTRAAYRLECDLMPVTIAMRRGGIRINQNAAEQGRDEFLAKRDAVLKELSDQHGALIGMDEINSSKWKIATFERHGIISPRKTPKGAPSFTAGNSGWMGGHEHWLPGLIARASKYHDTACKFFQGHILDHSIGGRIYAEFHQFKTEEGGTKSLRFSVSQPPLQQMPIRDEETGPPIRRVFEADEGCCMAKCDVSQQEFRILVDKAERHGLPGAKGAGDEYRNNSEADYHKYVAELAELDRKAAKQTNFMKIYGGGAAAIARKTGLSPEKASEVLAKYDAALPFVKQLSQIYQRQAESTGITEIMGGAKRHWNKFEAPWKGDTPCSLEEARLRVADPEHPWHGQKLRRAKTYRALNAAIQGDAAIHVKQWMLACFREGITPSLQIHDELLCNVKTRKQGELIAQLGEQAIKLSVPMRVDLKFGRNWADATHSWEEPTGEATPTKLASPKPLNPIEPTIAVAPNPAIVQQRPPFEADQPIDQGDPDEQQIPESNGHDISPPPEPCPTVIEVHQVWVTRFADIFGKSLSHGYLTLPKIAAGIADETARTKEALPLLKLQRYGNIFSSKHCLRHDDNVLEISGLETEHDAGTLPLTNAIVLLRNANIRCIVHTSPSYIPGEKERWRVLAPTSQLLAPSFRVGLVARLNGILGGALAGESFTLSQPFHYGSVNNNPNHRVEVIDGDLIDLRNDLAAGAIFKDGSRVGEPVSTSPRGGNAKGGRSPSEPWEDLVIKILRGEPLHPSLLALSAKMVAAGMNGAAVENFLRGLMEKSAAPRDARWQDRYDDIPRLVSSAEQFRAAPAIDTTALFERLKGKNGAGPNVHEAAADGASGGSDTGLVEAFEAAKKASGAGTRAPRLIEARPFVLRDPKTLPKQQWLYGNHLIRKFGSATFAPSGSGKSNLFIVEALVMVTGRPLLGTKPPQRLRVWYWNGEDPYDELEQRVGAACLHYGITAAEIEGWLFINSGRDPNSRVVIATQDRNGTTIAVPVVEAMIQTIRDNRLDVEMIDPFISTHRVPENDNNAIDEVAKTWTGIADITDTAVSLAHHTRKTGGAEVTVEDGRGAVALLNAVRPARVVNMMTEEEALKAGVVDGRRRYFKVADGKNNLALPLDRLDWFRSESVFLGNGDTNDPSDKGDNKGVVTKWEWPDAMKGITEEAIEKVKAAIRAGEWRKDSQAKDWVGHPVAKALGLGDVRKKGLDRTKVTTIINNWVYKGKLVVVVREDKKRMPKEFVEVAEAGSNAAGG